MRRRLIAALSIAVVVGGAATANAASDDHSAPGPSDHRPTSRDSALARDFSRLERGTSWKLTNTVKLDFPTFHTEGMAFAGDRMFLSAVEILEPTQKYPTPQDGYDRSPGKGIGHLFVMDRQGKLQKDIVLGEGDMYHPGGIDSDGQNIWVPVAQYRPNSSAIIYRVDATTLAVHKEFETRADHIGGIVRKPNGHLVGNSWGSRRFYEWNKNGKLFDSWDNPQQFVDYQDCQYVPDDKMICSGLAGIAQTPGAGGPDASYPLGGLAMYDLRTRAILNEVPFQKFSDSNTIMTQNPLKMAADGDALTLWAAPDSDETEVYTFQTTVPAAGSK